MISGEQDTQIHDLDGRIVVKNNSILNFPQLSINVVANVNALQ